MIRLFITDDHSIVIFGIRRALEAYPDIRVVDTAQTARETEQKLDSLDVDVLLLDVHLPDQDGVDLCRTLLQAHPGLKIIGLTTFTQVSFIAEMLRNGAEGYLFKKN